LNNLYNTASLKRHHMYYTLSQKMHQL